MTKFATPPARLVDACLQQERDRHTQRLKEIEAMSVQLDLLEQYMPALRAADLFIWAGDIHRDHRTKSLRIERALFGTANQARLIALLIEQGFTQSVSSDFGTWAIVDLTKGHLRISFSVDRQREGAPAASLPAAPPGTQHFSAQGTAS